MVDLLRIFRTSLRARLMGGFCAVLAPLVVFPVPPNDYIIHGNPAEREEFKRLVGKVEACFARQLAAPEADGADGQALVRVAREEWERARSMGERILALPRPDPAILHKEMEEFDAQIDRTVAALERLHDFTKAEIEGQARAMALSVWRRASLIFASVFLLEAVIVVAAGIVLGRSVLVPILTLEEGARRFGEGDLSHRVSLDRGDELGRLAGAFNTMAERIEKSQRDLMKLSIRDSLTGLYNAGEFARRVEEEKARQERTKRPFSLLMLDLDRFKEVNDTYGHPAGDAVLKAVVTILLSELRQGDTLCRYGGEEFAVILPETPGGGAIVAAERVRGSVAAAPITIAWGKDVHVTVSIGAAVFPDDAKSPEALVAMADEALYAAKRAGRNRVRRFEGAEG
ncbi:MAG: diguanylate cyclase [Nitrospirota bacterium]